MTAPPGQLALRAAAFGLAAVSLGALGHRAARGHLPGLLPWASFAVLVALLVLPLLRRERRWLSIVVALALVQLGLHAGFTSSFGAGEHVHAVGEPAAPSWPMLALHAAAVLASAWWLRCGEAALWRRLRRIAAAALELVARASARPPRPANRGAEPLIERPAARPAPVLRPVVDRISGRGPPSETGPWFLAIDMEEMPCIAS
jgi:hypothetical protein